MSQFFRYVCFPGLYLGAGICSVISGASHVLKVIYLSFTFTFSSHSEELLPFFSNGCTHFRSQGQDTQITFKINIYYIFKYILKSDDLSLLDYLSFSQPCYCKLAKGKQKKMGPASPGAIRNKSASFPQTADS